MTTTDDRPEQGAADATPRHSGARAWIIRGLYVLLLAVLAKLLYPFTALPITWDELLYMGVAYTPEPQTCALNRYTHIYLLSLLMWLANDPYRGARILWCLAVAGSFTALVWSTAPLRTPLRAFVLLTTTLLLLSQDVGAWTLGIAYTDYTVMLIITLSAALVLPHILRHQPIPAWLALVLGALFVFGLRAKEVSLVLGVLVPVLWLQPGTGLRPTRAGAARLGAYVAGGALALGVLLALDGWLLGDAGFLLRAESWRALLAFNQVAGRYESTLNWLGWMLRPENFTAFLLYTATLVAVAAGTRDMRLMLVFLIPLLYFLQLIATFATGNSLVVARYALPVLPLMCLAAAFAAGRLLEQTATAPWARAGVLWAGAFLAAAGLVFVLLGHERFVWRADHRFLHEVVFPGTVFGAVTLLALAAAGPPRWRAPLGLLTFACLCGSALPPALRVTHEAANLELKRHADNRFHDLRYLTRRLPAGPDTRFLVAADLYERQLAERGPWAFQALLAMGTRTRLRPDQITIAEDLPVRPTDELRTYDYVVASPKAAQGLLARLADGPADAARWELLPGPRSEVSVLRRTSPPRP